MRAKIKQDRNYFVEMLALLMLFVLGITHGVMTSPHIGDKTNLARTRLVTEMRGSNNVLQPLEEATEIVNAIVELERCFIHFTSGDFIDMALTGEWSLNFAACRKKAVQDQEEEIMKINEIVQTVCLDQGQGSLVNCISWQWGQDVGQFEARCTLQALEEPRSRFLVTLQDHRLLPASKLNLSPATIVNQLALTIPFELFDPDGSLLDLVYADPMLRISRQAPGSRRAVGAAHVWSRLNQNDSLLQ